MNDDKNLYYNPEAFGLEIFEQINDDHSSYDFDDFVIFRQLSDGKLFYGLDSGCSYPTPFEEQDLSNLTPITDLQQLEIVIDAYRDAYRTDDNKKCTSERKQEVLRKVKDYLIGIRK